MSFTISSNERIEGTVDVEALVASIPANYTVKGMFCARFVEALASEYRQVEPLLVAAPRLGRYLPFHSYPQADYQRLCLATAAKRFPRIGTREAVRRVARDDLQTFASSIIGKVVLALVADVRSTLLRLPDAYARVTVGGYATAEELDAQTLRIEFHGYHGMVDYTLGQMEGVVLHYGGVSNITCNEVEPNHIVFDVVHGI